MYLAGALISELEEAGINVLYRIGAVDKTNGKPRPFRAGRRSVTFALIDIWAQGAIKITIKLRLFQKPGDNDSYLSNL